jgi:Methyltransferase domain
MLSRFHVISRFLQLFDTPSYLEIGVDRGETFHNLRASLKIGVDPKFAFDTNPYREDRSIELHEVPSDEFFASISKSTKRFDVIYLDGLHTFEQTLRDFLNATAVLRQNGVIIIDDVLPNSFDASLPDFHQVTKLRQISSQVRVNWPFDGSWMGDVFKVPFFIESFLQQFSHATVAENHGQTVVWRQTRLADAIPHRSVEQIARLDYRDTILTRSSLNILGLDAIVALVEAASAR